VAAGSPAAERVAELASELSSEARFRGDAAAEIERLLDPGGAAGGRGGDRG
jgi:hypothetical protein